MSGTNEDLSRSQSIQAVPVASSGEGPVALDQTKTPSHRVTTFNLESSVQITKPILPLSTKHVPEGFVRTSSLNSSGEGVYFESPSQARSTGYQVGYSPQTVGSTVTPGGNLSGSADASPWFVYNYSHDSQASQVSDIERHSEREEDDVVVGLCGQTQGQNLQQGVDGSSDSNARTVTDSQAQTYAFEGDVQRLCSNGHDMLIGCSHQTTGQTPESRQSMHHTKNKVRTVRQQTVMVSFEGTFDSSVQVEQGVLGRGITSAVQLAWDRRAKRQVAVKHVWITTKEGRQNVRSEQEVQMPTKPMLREHLVDQLGAYTQDGCVAMVLEHLSLDLAHYIREQRKSRESQAGAVTPAAMPVRTIMVKDEQRTVYTSNKIVANMTVLSEATLQHIARDVCLGLHALHSSGLLHNDQKPENVLLCSNTGKVKITDFGLAGKSTSNKVVGTSVFQAPEYVLSAQAVPSSGKDVWALGQVLYYGATGMLPTKNLEYWQQQSFLESYESGSWKVPGISSEFQEFIALCLEKDPGNRASVETQQQHAFLQIDSTEKWVCTGLQSERQVQAQNGDLTIVDIMPPLPDSIKTIPWVGLPCVNDDTAASLAKTQAATGESPVVVAKIGRSLNIETQLVQAFAIHCLTGLDSTEPASSQFDQT